MKAAAILILAIVSGVAVYVLSLHLEEEGRVIEGPQLPRWIRRRRGEPAGSTLSAGAVAVAGEASGSAVEALSETDPEQPFGDSFALEGRRVREHIPLRTRVVGIVGLVILVPLGAGLIGVGLYWLGHMARVVFERWAGAV